MRTLILVSVEGEVEERQLPDGWKEQIPISYTYEVNLGLFNVKFSSNEFLTKQDIIQKLDTMMKLWLQDRS